ncbi:MAG: hypothetical protein GY841_22925, partial [FCB group bacterium]|nr:hypothetical protein [FCB group bacterium]
MSKKYYDIMTPTWGRLVGGSTTKPQTKDYEGQPLVYKSGAKEGQPRNAYFIPVAINKNDPELVAIKSIIHAAAKEGFPDLIGDEIDLELDFSFKITDGDSAKKNKRGHKPCDNEGY